MKSAYPSGGWRLPARFNPSWRGVFALLALWLFSPLLWAAVGDITTVAGDGTAGYSGDGGPATSAQLNRPYDVVVDGNGNLYITDYNNHRVRKVDAAGVIITIAGDGTAGYSGDGGPAASAQLSFPYSLALDRRGNLYIADQGNACIRKVDAATGVITTVAGNGTFAYSEDGGLATSSTLHNIYGIAVDRSGNIYISENTGSNRVRKVDAATGIITTVAGNGTSGYSGDGGPATSAQLLSPYDVALDSDGNLYIAVSEAGGSTYRIRKVDAATGVINTIVGTGSGGYSGDGGLATSAQLRVIFGLVLDSDDNLFLADTGNSRIRRVDPVSGVITTIAGSGSTRGGYGGDGGPATSAQLGLPNTVALDSSGNLYIADTNNQRIRKIELAATPSDPDNYPTGFAAAADSDSQITTTWTDAASGRLPDHYLVMCSTSDSFTPPTDGVAQADDSDCADGTGVMSVAAGVQAYVWTGLDAGTTYYFRIYPDIDNDAVLGYKTDGTAPSTSATTKLNQVITFDPATPDSKTLDDAPFGLNVASSSGLAVTLGTFTTSVCTVSGTTVTLLTAGTCTLTANQAGNGSYNAAPQATHDITVSAVDHAPVIANPTSDVAVDENSADSSVDLGNVFSDPDGDAIVLSVQGNTNSALVTPTLNGTSLTLAYAAGKSGTADITIRATTNGKTVDDTFKVTVSAVDHAPIVANPASDLTVDENSADSSISLGNVFSDPDSDAIVLSVQGNTNSTLVTPTLNGTTLTLTYAAGKNGTADITIRATANGKTVDDTFTVTVNNTAFTGTTPSSGATASLVVSGGAASITSASFIAPPAGTGVPDDEVFPYDMIDFTLQCAGGACTGPVTITLTYPEAIPSGAKFWKESGGVYTEYPATISGNTVTYTITDNGGGDDNPATGVIHDPAGITVSATRGDGSGSAGAGGGGSPDVFGVFALIAFLIGKRFRRVAGAVNKESLS